LKSCQLAEKFSGVISMESSRGGELVESTVGILAVFSQVKYTRKNIC